MMEWVPSEWNNIDKEWESLYLSISYTHSLIGAHEWERRSSLNVWERDCYCQEIILLFSGFNFDVDSISEEVAGFSPLWFPRGKLFVSLVLCEANSYSLVEIILPENLVNEISHNTILNWWYELIWYIYSGRTYICPFVTFQPTVMTIW